MDALFRTFTTAGRGLSLCVTISYNGVGCGGVVSNFALPSSVRMRCASKMVPCRLTGLITQGDYVIVYYLSFPCAMKLAALMRTFTLNVPIVYSHGPGFRVSVSGRKVNVAMRCNSIRN